MKPFRLDDTFSAYEQAGAGDKVLWIHGYTLNASSWQPLWQLLPDWHHVGIDLPGHGASGPWPKGVTMPSLARQLGALAIEQGVQHLVALSFGTMLGLQMVIEFPDAFASLTLGAPALAGGETDPKSGMRYGEMMQLFWQRGAGPWMTELWMKSPPDIFSGAKKHPQLWEQLKEILNAHEWPELRTGSMGGLVQGFEQTAVSLNNIRTPVLVLVGDEEMAAFKNTAVTLETEIPTCQRIELSQTGHLCMLEVPTLCAPLIDQHLRVHSLTQMPA